MHHVLNGESKRFYREKILSSCATFAGANSMMQEEFNSLTRQNRVRKHLEKLRFSTIVGNRRCTVTEALEELREIITKLTPRGPRTHRSEEDKMKYLYKAVVGATWDKSALSSSQSASPPWNFQTLYAALDAAWLQEQEEVEARQFDGKVHGRSETTVVKQIPGLYFQGQGMYGRPKAPGYLSSAPSRSSIGNTSTALQERMELIGLGSLDCATIVSRQIISFKIATNRAIFFVTLLRRSRTTENRSVKSCLKCVCKLKMPASLTKTKNSSHYLPKLRTAKKLDRIETMLTSTTFSLLILQTSEEDPPVRDFTMKSNVRIFRWRCICHRYLTSTPQLTDAVLQNKRQNDSDVHFANDVGTNQQWRGPRESILVMFERDDVCSLQIPNVNARGENSDNSSWNGACVDTGAQKTVIGLPQALSYSRFVRKKFTVASAITCVSGELKSAGNVLTGGQRVC
jgi:hypothetical protein